MARQASVWLCVSTALPSMLTGCVTTPRTVSPIPAAIGEAASRQGSAPGMMSYQLAMGEVSSGAAPIRRVMPIYPAGQLAACPPAQEVRALLSVDPAGKVSEVRVVDEIQADTNRRPFIGAVRVAALQWRFNPLQVSRWAADANGNSHVVDEGSKAFSIGYEFRFECHAGQSSVSMEASGAAHP